MMGWRRHIVTAVAAIVLLAVTGVAALGADTRYHPTMLEDLHGLGTAAYDMNDACQVVGFASTGWFEYEPFLWDPLNGMRALDMGEWPRANASTINNLGVAAGTLESDDGYEAVIWDAEGHRTSIGPISFGAVHDINDLGQVVGRTNVPSGERPIRAFLWDPVDGMTDIGTLGGPWTEAEGINNLEQVVGWSLAGGMYPKRHAFLWDPVNDMQDLGHPVGMDSWASAINDAGQVAGRHCESCGLVDTNSRAFLWDADNGMQDLGTLGGDSAQPKDINESGQVVGLSRIEAGSNKYNRAFVWDAANGMRNLNDMLDTDIGPWVLHAAVGINSAGQIIANGTDYDFGNPRRCFLLTPLPPTRDFIRSWVQWVAGGLIPPGADVHADGKLDHTDAEAVLDNYLLAH